MSAVQRSSAEFPKSARLLKPTDFRFSSYRRFETPLFKILYGAGGSGRLGISLSKKVLRRATARNRVRRLLKESFRLCREDFASLDIHVIGLPALSGSWREIGREDVDAVFAALRRRAAHAPAVRPRSDNQTGITGIERASSLGSA
jgi:ribonuclease P protein component